MDGDAVSDPEAGVHRKCRFVSKHLLLSCSLLLAVHRRATQDSQRHECVGVPVRAGVGLEEGVGFPGAQVRGDCELSSVGVWNGTLVPAGSARTLTDWVFSPASTLVLK